MEKVIALLLIILLIIIGLIKQIIFLIKLKKRLNFTTSYRNKFISLVNKLDSTKKIDNDIYYDLTESVNKMQQELGEDGILSYFADNLTGIQTRNYQYLINFLPSLRKIDFGNSIILDRYNDSVFCCDDMFVRHIGTIKNSISDVKKTFFNPFLCFSFGVKFIITLPISIMKWFGFISEKNYTKILQSGITAIVNMMMTILSFAGSIISVTIGWKDFIKILSSLFCK